MDNQARQEIVAILANASDMTIATIRPDGYPQATTVSYVSDGMNIYFGAMANSQKARNIALCDKVSLTVNLPYATWDEIRGLSMGARVTRVTDSEEMAKIGRLMTEKFPRVAEYGPADLEGFALFRITPEVVSVLDYRLGFGHTDLINVA